MGSAQPNRRHARGRFLGRGGFWRRLLHGRQNGPSPLIKHGGLAQALHDLCADFAQTAPARALPAMSLHTRAEIGAHATEQICDRFNIGGVKAIEGGGKNLFALLGDSRDEAPALLSERHERLTRIFR